MSTTQLPTSRETRAAQRQRGMALLLVLFALAAATIMSLAILSSSSLQAQVSGNAAQSLAAEYLADSGLQLAAYYLQDPSKAPFAQDATFWASGVQLNGISLGAAVSGSIDLTITPDPATAGALARFLSITATSHTTSGGGTVLSRSASAIVRVNYVYKLSGACAFGSALTLIGPDTLITGDVRSRSQLNVNSGATVNGTVYAPTCSYSGNVSNFIATPASDIAVPTASSIRSYLSYRQDGVEYQAVKLTGNSLTGVTLGPTAGNPAGVYWYDATLALLGNVNINGTLIVKNGRLITRGTLNRITAASGFPALLIDQDLNINGSSVSLVVNGLVWAGTGLTRTGVTVGSTLTINGGLITGTSATYFDSFAGSVRITRRDDYVNVPDFSAVGSVPQSVMAIAWNLDRRSSP